MSDQPPPGTYSRRAFVRVAGLAGAVGGLGLAGCVGEASRGDGDHEAETIGSEPEPTTRESGGGQSTTIAILSAGSLQNAFSNGLAPTLDVPVRIEAHGSATVARLIDEGQRDPDIVSVADRALFEGPLSSPWHSVFASNAIVIAYNPDTDGGKRIAEAGTEHWHEPMASGDIRLGRTDPDQDPLGYRALFMLELASRYYDDASNLRTTIPKRNQIYPETALISQFETGGIDAALAYRNMAIERDYEYIELPDRIDLSNPQYNEAWYSTVSYTLPSDHEIQGGLIGYASTIREMSDTALEVFVALTTGDYLDEAGFRLRDGVPRYVGNVPERVVQATGQPPENRVTTHADGRQSRRRGRTAERSSTVSDITVLL